MLYHAVNICTYVCRNKYFGFYQIFFEGFIYNKEQHQEQYQQIVFHFSLINKTPLVEQPNIGILTFIITNIFIINFIYIFWYWNIEWTILTLVLRTFESLNKVMGGSKHLDVKLFAPLQYSLRCNKFIDELFLMQDDTKASTKFSWLNTHFCYIKTTRKMLWIVNNHNFPIDIDNVNQQLCKTNGRELSEKWKKLLSVWI